MKNLNDAIWKAKSLEELLPLLDYMRENIDRITSTNYISPSDMQKIVHCLTEIRLQLNQLDRVDERLGITVGRGITARYLKLEGKIKELRNDLDLAMKRCHSDIS